MRKQLFIIPSILILTIPSISISRDFHFGIISAVKEKVEEIKEAKEKDKLPAIETTTLVNGSKVSGTVDITLEAKNTIKVEFYVDGVLKAADTTEPYYYSLDTSQYANGTHIIEVKAYNAEGQTSKKQYTITIDNDYPPVITIISLAANPTLSGIVDIITEANDDKGISRVEFSIDGLLVSTDTNPLYSYNWNTSLYANGSHTLEAKAYDTANQTARVQYSVSIDNTWKIEIVDSTDKVGRYSSLAIDSSNNPHIAYQDGTNMDLKYAHWTGTKWSIETVDSDWSVGGFCSLALDNNNNPHIAYFDYTYMDLKYAYWDGTTWNIEIVDSEGYVGTFSSIAIDSNNTPHIAYFDVSSGYLKYAHKKLGQWEITSIVLDGNRHEVDKDGWNCSLAIDSNNYPHIAYFYGQDANLRYAHWTGTAWRIEIVDSERTVGGYNSIALDSGDNPHISYYDATWGLKYAYWTGTEWKKDVVGDNLEWVGWYSSLALDSNNNPHIAYLDIKNYDLKYAQWTGKIWKIEIIDSSGWVGECSSLALDSSNHPHIAYYDGVKNTNYSEMHDDLKYATTGK